MIDATNLFRNLSYRECQDCPLSWRRGGRDQTQQSGNHQREADRQHGCRQEAVL